MSAKSLESAVMEFTLSELLKLTRLQSMFHVILMISSVLYPLVFYMLRLT